MSRNLTKEVMKLTIKDLRVSKNLTQEDVAGEIGVSRSTVAMWETENSLPRAETLIKLAKLFDCSVDDLLTTE